MSYVKRIISGLCSLAMISSYAQVFDFNVWAEDSVIDSEVETETIPEESEGIKYGDINRDSKIDETDCTELSKAINNKTASVLLNADLNGDGKVNNADALVLNQYVTGEIKYFSVGEYYLEDVSFVTRGEWIHNLVETYDMSVEDESSIVEYYTDIAENQYASDINLAANFGVFEIESDKFNPDSLVTREFAAHTANFCAGYLNEITVKFADTDNIYYEDDAVVSIEHGWFECIDEEFRPMMYMKSTESEVILSDLIGSNEEIVIDEDAENVIEYSEDVITIDSNVDVTKLENTVVINDENISIMPGNIFMVTIDDSQFIYKAKAVSMNSNGAVVIEIEDVSIEEAVDSIDIQGYGEVDYDNITYYGEEVSTEIDPEEAVNTFNSSALKNDSQSKRFELSRKFNLAGLDVEISGAITNIKPEYKVKYDGKNVESFYLNVDADANLTAKVSGEFEDTRTKSKEVKIGSLPVAFGGPLTVEIGVYATVSLSGEITVSYSWGINGGVSYTENNGWRTTKNFQKKSFTLDAFGDESVSIKASVMAKFCGMKLAEMYLMVGETAHFATNLREDGTECATIRGHLFAEVGVNADLFGVKQFSHSIQFINESNSPLKITKHWENDILVDKCKYEDINSGTTGTIVKKKKYKNYTDYEEYGIEYKDLITASNSADSKSDGSITNWEGDIVLSSNTVIYGDLNLDSFKVIEDGKTVTKYFDSLDLNGYTLTVYGDVYHKRGEILFHNGSLKIDGTYLNATPDVDSGQKAFYNSSEGYLKMVWDEDYMYVGGDFITNTSYRTDSTLSTGTIEIKGDLLDYTTNGYYFWKASGTNKVVLIGTGNQIVHLEDSYAHFNNFEIQNSDTRSITLSGYYRTANTTSDKSNLKVISEDGIASFENLKSTNLDIDGNFTFGSGKTVLENSDINVNGDLVVASSIDLGSCEVYVTGTLDHDSGEILFHNGSLKIDGTYLNATPDVDSGQKAFYNSSEGCLKMVWDEDYMYVGGDFITNTRTDSTLSTGTIEIKGDLLDYTTNGYYFWKASGTNKVVLIGTGNQIVHLENSDAHLNILELTNPMSNYTFNPDPCWNELIKCASETTTATTTVATTTTSTTTEKLTTTTHTTTEVPTTTSSTTTKKPTTTVKITTEVPTTTASTTTKKLATTIKTTTEVSTTTASTTTEEPTTTINTTTEVPVVTTTISSETNPVEIVISDTTATKGEKVSISIDIENNPGVANAEFDVTFDSECLEFIDAQSGDAMADTEFSCDISEDGTLHISFIGEGKGSGTMAVLNFNVLKTPEDSKVSVTIVDDSAKITDLNGEDVEFEVVYDAESDSSAGDVNNDGEIDLKDVVLIRRFIAGGWDVELDPEDADVNNDNEVDLKDVVLIRRYIAGGWDVELA